MKCFGESSLRDVSTFGVSKVDRNFARGGEMWIGFLDRRALLDVLKRELKFVGGTRLFYIDNIDRNFARA